MNRLNRKSARIFYPLAALSALGSLVYAVAALSHKVSLSPVHHVACLAPLFALIYLSGLVYSKDPSVADRHKVMKRTFVFLLILYSFAVICLTLFDGYMGRTGFVSFDEWKQMTPEKLDPHLNLVPFNTLTMYVKGIFNNNFTLWNITINLLGNAVVFMPFACLLPAVFEKLSKAGWFILTMVCVVSAIEICQLVLLTGCCDIDDLILNVIGAIAAFGVLKIPFVKKIICRLLQKE